MSPAEQQPQQQSQAADTRRATIQLLEIIGETELRQSYAKDLIAQEVSRDAFDQDWRLARVFAQSGIFEEVKNQTPEQAIATAMTKIRMGRAWGINEADAMRFIFFQNGKPSIENELIAAKLQQAGWDWDIEWSKDEKSSRCTGCKLWAKRADPMGVYQPRLDKNGKQVSVEFTEAMASQVKIWEKGSQITLLEKWNYKSWPQDMYFSKAIARFKRRLAPGILSGAITKDEAEEMEPEPASSVASASIQRATDAKTEDLAEKLKAKREPKAKVDAPAPVVVMPAPAADPVAPAPVESDNPWPKRAADTFLMQLGPERFQDALMEAIGTVSLKAINSDNYKKVWQFMGAAKAKAPVETGPPTSITSPELAPNVKGQEGLF